MNQYSFYKMQVKHNEDNGYARLYLHYSYLSYVDVLVPPSRFYHGIEEVTTFGKIKYQIMF
jgi:hypothetical protein